METTAIRQLLKSLCTNSTWLYAVFWKIQQQNHMLLTCEDWYCEDSRFQQSCPLILSDNYSRQEDGIHFGFETNFWIGDSMGYSLGPAIADMSCQQYELGEGLVGRVALSGNDIWIYSDDINSTEFISKLECPDDWLLPIMAGITTTLLVPILPHGVLQFGSLDKVAENLEVVADIKEKFIALQCPTFTLPFASDENPLLFSSILMSEMENTDESSFSSNNLPQRMESEDSLELHTPELTENEFSTADQVMFPFTIGNSLALEDVATISPFSDELDISYPFLGFDVESNTLDQSVITNMPEMENIWTLFSQEEGYYDGGICKYLLSQEVQQPSAAGNEDKTSPANMGNFEDFTRDCELYKALGTAFPIENHRHSSESYESNVYIGGSFDPFAMEPSGSFDKGGANSIQRGTRHSRRET